jgi:hypothetical protein
MSKAYISTPAPSGKPAKPVKPYPEFPLRAHPAGYWCKKIRGKLHYFGPRFDPADAASVASAVECALADYSRKAEALHAGRAPPEVSERLTSSSCATGSSTPGLPVGMPEN